MDLISASNAIQVHALSAAQDSASCRFNVLKGNTQISSSHWNDRVTNFDPETYFLHFILSLAMISEQSLKQTAIRLVMVFTTACKGVKSHLIISSSRHIRTPGVQIETDIAMNVDPARKNKHWYIRQNSKCIFVPQ